MKMASDITLLLKNWVLQLSIIFYYMKQFHAIFPNFSEKLQEQCFVYCHPNFSYFLMFRIIVLTLFLLESFHSMAIRRIAYFHVSSPSSHSISVGDRNEEDTFSS